MATITLNQRLKDPKGNYFGEKISCMVMNTDKELTKKTDGNYLILRIDNGDFKQVLREVIETSLLHENPKSPLTRKVKNERYKLWLKVTGAEETIELKSEEVIMIKECIGDFQPIIIVGQCDEMLEGVVIDKGDEDEDKKLESGDGEGEAEETPAEETIEDTSVEIETPSQNGVEESSTETVE